MKKLLVAVLLLALILLGLDRGGAYAASRVLASKIKTQQHLQDTPKVTVHGFPFLTQVVGGKYTEVDVVAKGLVGNGLRIAEIDVAAHGIKVALGDAIHGRVSDVPVEEATGVVHLSYADVNALLAKRADRIPSISYDTAGRVKVHARLSALGETVTPAVSADVSVDGDVLRVVPLADSLSAIPSLLRPLARSALTFSVPVTGLPFGIHLRSGTVTSGGLVLVADVSGAVFPVDATT